MQVTNCYQAKYLAYLLHTEKSDGVERISNVLLDAKVDVNPHQIKAAVAALNNPFCKGMLLCDEVGLGKTIEAGLVISQKWAENKRKIIVIVPSMLKRQWASELDDKFYLPVKIVEKGQNIEELSENIIICSYNYAYQNELMLRQINWDMVVFDEAHKMRNVYKNDSIIASSIKTTFANTYKLLLTATPLQNSILELYGLVSIIDENIFGDLESFRNNYINNKGSNVGDLAARISYVSTRTLRRQVAEYIKYTNRLSITQEFTPTILEQELYNKLCSYVYKNTQALKNMPRYLVALMLLKQLSSSSVAVGATLAKLRATLNGQLNDENIFDDIEIDEDEGEETHFIGYENKMINKADVEEELKELDDLISLANNIKTSAKVEALKAALKIGFDKLKKLGAKQKAVIFTESLKTQEMLKQLLSENVLIINGSTPNRHEIIQQFEENGKILIATEVGSEGLNLQFCSLVVNYDLPWNPQRIEQRIGRCHRYGQKYDVVVVNFLNKNNLADIRLYELLHNKLSLFTGMFGASDTVLGVLEDIDFERQIATIYASCRTDKQIEQAFLDLKKALDEQIKQQLTITKRQVLDQFDDEVAQKLKLTESDAINFLSKNENILWQLTKYALSGYASFFEDKTPFYFILHKNKVGQHYADRITYTLDKFAAKGARYRLNSPIAKEVLFDLKHRQANFCGSVNYELNAMETSILTPLVGKHGTLALYNFSSYGLGQDNELVFVGRISTGQELTHEQCEKLIMQKSVHAYEDIPEEGAEISPCEQRIMADGILKKMVTAKLPFFITRIEKRNSHFLEIQIETLEKWAKDRKNSLEKKLREYDGQIAELKQQVKRTTILEQKIALLDQIKQLEQKQSKKRLEIYEAQEKIIMQKDELINAARKKLTQTYKTSQLFAIEWSVGNKQGAK